MNHDVIQLHALCYAVLWDGACDATVGFGRQIQLVHVPARQ